MGFLINMQYGRAFSFRQFVALSLVLLVAMPLAAEPNREALMKTAILFNFFKFIEWPDAATQESYRLCSTVNDHLGGGLGLLASKTIRSKPMAIYREIEGEELKKCHMVFMGSDSNVTEIIAFVKGLPIVTVSDQPGFVAKGGMIGLVQEGGRLGFDINLGLANAEGVHISAQLLKLAKNVNTPK
jgi:hypothetical protein